MFSALAALVLTGIEIGQVGAIRESRHPRGLDMGGQAPEDVGSALAKAVDSYNRAAGSLETRYLPSVRKFKELGATAADDIPTLEPVEQAPRTLANENE